MSNNTCHDRPHHPESAEKEASAGEGTSFPCQEWMKRMMAAAHSFSKPMWAACCGKPEKAKEKEGG